MKKVYVVLFFISLLALLSGCNQFYTKEESNVIKTVIEKYQKEYDFSEFSTKKELVTKEKEIGGPYGAHTDVEFKTDIRRLHRRNYIVIFSKNWHIGDDISYWVFRIKNGEISLIAEENYDNKASMGR